LRSRRDLLPLYLQIEPWVASIEAEAVATIRAKPQERTPRDLELLKAVNVSLGLCILERVHRYGGPELAAPGIAAFPDTAATDFDSWIRRQQTAIRAVVESGRHFGPEFEGFPPLFGFTQDIASNAMRREGRRIVLLIDQVDRSSAFHFEALASLLRRGSFTTIIATRPCPCAPYQTPLLEGTGQGVDFAVHWLGTNPRSDEWRELLREIVIDAPVKESTKEWVVGHLHSLSSLLGTSNRALLTFCLELDRLETPPALSWHLALSKVINDQEGSAVTVLGAYCKEPTFLLERLRQAGLDVRREAQKGPGPVVIHFRGDELFSGHEHFLRVATREGLFLPVPREGQSLDAVATRYELNPVLAAPKSPAALEYFDDDTVEATVDLSSFKNWLNWDPPSRGRKRRTIWISCAAGALGREFVQRLEDGLLGRARILTDRDMPPPSPQFATEIRKLIGKDASLALIELTGNSREVYAELGFAIGAYRVTFFACREDEDKESLPAWLRQRHIYTHASSEEMSLLVSGLLDSLDRPPSRTENWTDDPANDSIFRKAEPNRIAVIGAGPALATLARQSKDILRPRGFEVDVLDMADVAREQTLFYKGIVVARRATHMLACLGGSMVTDLVTICLAGVFAYNDTGTEAQKKFRRRLAVFNGTGRPDREQVPGMLTGRVDTSITTDVNTAVDYLLPDPTAAKSGRRR